MISILYRLHLGGVIRIAGPAYCGPPSSVGETLAEPQQILACGAALGLCLMTQPGKAVHVWRGLTDGACVGWALRRGLEARCHNVTDFRSKNVINSGTDEHKI